MARYTESVCRQCRREGVKLFLKGDRCYTAKCAVVKRHTIPGQHGQSRQRKMSEYGIQLRVLAQHPVLNVMVHLDPCEAQGLTKAV